MGLSFPIRMVKGSFTKNDIDMRKTLFYSLLVLILMGPTLLFAQFQDPLRPIFNTVSVKGQLVANYGTSNQFRFPLIKGDAGLFLKTLGDGTTTWAVASGSSGVPTSRSLTFTPSGTITVSAPQTNDLTADRTWNIGIVDTPYVQNTGDIMYNNYTVTGWLKAKYGVFGTGAPIGLENAAATAAWQMTLPYGYSGSQTYAVTPGYPAANGYLLSSTTSGIQSWVNPATFAGLASASGTPPLTLNLASNALTGSVAQFNSTTGGIVPATGPIDAAKFLRMDGTWTAPGGGTVPLTNMIYVDARSGNDATATVGDNTRPFLTLRSAIDAWTKGKSIIVFPGTYTVETTSNGGEGFNLYRKSTGAYCGGITYYFYAGARVIKSASYSMIMGAQDAQGGIYIYGQGTFIRNGTYTSSYNAASVMYGNMYCYWEADTVSSSFSNAITNGWGSNTVPLYFKIKYYTASGHIFQGLNFNIDGGYFYSATANIYGIYATWNGGFLNVIIKNVFINLPGSGCVGICISNQSYGIIEASIWAPTGVYIAAVNADYTITLNGGSMTTYALNDAASGGIINLFMNQQWATSNIYCNSTAAKINVCGNGNMFVKPIVVAGMVVMNGVANNRGDYIQTPIAEVSGGTLIYKGVFDYTMYRQNGINVTGGKVIVDGMINYYSTSGYQQDPITALFQMKGGDLILTKNARVNITNLGGLYPQWIINFQKNGKLIDYGSVLRFNGGKGSIMVEGYHVGSVDTLAVSYYHYGDTYTNLPFSVRPTAAGCCSWGYNFATNPKTFIISRNGAANDTIHLTQDCSASLAALMTYFNAQLVAKGINDIEMSNEMGYGGFTMFIRTKLPACNNIWQYYFEIRSCSFATLYGFGTRLYKASIYQKTATPGRLLVDANVITE